MDTREFLELVWFDSLGAKSACILLKHGDKKIIVDPGVAIMHPSYPAPREVKIKLREEARKKIVSWLQESSIVIITHYHYDHYLHEENEIPLYLGKRILAKNPNEYINDSQRNRAYHFYEKLYAGMGLNLAEILLEPEEKEYPDPLQDLTEALRRDYGDYAKRKQQLLSMGLQWFMGRVSKWKSYKRIPEIRGNNTIVEFVDGRTIEYDGVRIKFTKPLFHGVEFSRVGWIISAIIELPKAKVYYSSDVNGPIIEDYALMIIDENPDILVLDGPPTYLLGYMLNQINLNRAIENLVRIIDESSRLKLIIYDHHLVREPRFRERTMKAWREAEKKGITMLTAAEYLGLKPHVLGYVG